MHMRVFLHFSVAVSQLNILIGDFTGAMTVSHTETERTATKAGWTAPGAEQGLVDLFRAHFS